MELNVFNFSEHRLNEYCVVKMSEHLAKLQIKIYEFSVSNSGADNIRIAR